LQDSSEESSEEEEKFRDNSLLNLDSVQFIDRYSLCRKELDNLMDRHRSKMKVLCTSLKKYTKKGVYNYLNEAYIRFNFNNYYIREDDDEL